MTINGRYEFSCSKCILDSAFLNCSLNLFEKNNFDNWNQSFEQSYRNQNQIIHNKMKDKRSSELGNCFILNPLHLYKINAPPSGAVLQQLGIVPGGHTEYKVSLLSVLHPT